MLTTLSDRTYRIITQLLFCVLALVVLFTFRDYGITWDEELQSDYGKAVFDFYASGMTDRHYDQIFNLYLYGGMFDGLAAALDKFTPNTIYETRHLLNAVVGLLGLWGTWRLGRLIGGGFVGLASLVLILITPMYYGHMFNNPKDIPFAAGVIWSLYYMCRMLMVFPKVRWPLLIKTGVIFGLTLGVRVNGIMIMGHWGLMLVLLTITNMPDWTLHQIQKSIVRLIKVIAPVFVIAYAVMLFCWPWAQEAPILNPLRAIMEFSNFPQDVEVLLNGVIFNSTELPWYYVPLYFFVQLPVLHIFLLLAGVFALIEIGQRLSRKGKRASIGLMLLTILFPVAYSVFRHPALYDAVRHFIFILPPLCILAALVLKKIVRAVLDDSEPGASPALKVACVAITSVLVLVPVYSMIRLHPYEYIYLNELEGGVQNGFGIYELDYWGSSFKEAAEDLKAYVERTDPAYMTKKYHVAICGPWSAASLYLPPNFEAVDADEGADFFLSTTRWMCQDMRSGREIVRIARFGVPLTIIKDIRGFPTP